MTYQDLKAALRIFDIGDRATLKQIKERHRSLVKQHHPDHAEQPDRETMQKINAAYAILRDYCENYRYSFTEAEFLEQVPAERLRRQFGWDPVWSGTQVNEQEE